MSPHCVWIITVGGGVGDTKGPVNFPNIVMLTELGKYVFLLILFIYFLFNLFFLFSCPLQL